jgi:hypothetical protein
VTTGKAPMLTAISKKIDHQALALNYILIFHIIALNLAIKF